MANAINSAYSAISSNRARVGGSGFTLFLWNGSVIPFAQQVSHTSPQPVGPGPVAIQPIDEPYPLQVITPQAAGMGSITLNLYELYGSKVWDNLGGGYLQGAVDIVDLFVAMAKADSEAWLTKLIRPPVIRGKTTTPYAEIYHGAVITNVVDGEQIEVGSMEILKQVTVGYRYMTNTLPDLKKNSGAGFNFRNGDLGSAAGTSGTNPPGGGEGG